MPALLKRTSSRPSSRFASANRNSTSSGTETSAATDMAQLPLVASSNFKDSFKVTIFLPASTSRKPLPPNASAAARPTPEPAPVINAVLSFGIRPPPSLVLVEE